MVHYYEKWASFLNVEHKVSSAYTNRFIMNANSFVEN